MSKMRDEGFALIAVMGLAALVTAVAIGGFILSRQVLNDASRIVGESTAFQVAQSGLDRELAAFNPDELVNGTYQRTGSTPDGEYTLTVAPLPGSAFEYIMTSVGVADDQTESVSMRFFYIDLWDMNIGAGQNASLGGGSGWNGTATIRGPMYVRGDFQWTSVAAYEGGPLFIRDGVLDVTLGAGTLGLEDPIKLYSTGGIEGDTSRVYIDGTVSSSVPDIDLPWVDDEMMDELMQLAMDESIDGYMGSQSREIVDSTWGDPPTTTPVVEASALNPASYPWALGTPRIVCPSIPVATSTYYKYIGPALGRSELGAGTTAVDIDLVSFGAWEGNGYPVGSGLHDDFAYDAGTGTLYVEGTVFIDGPLHIGPNVTSYVGNGTLVVNGFVKISADLSPRDGISTEQALGIVTPGDVVVGGSALYPPNVFGRFTGAVFANGEVGLYHTGSAYTGSILAGSIYGDLPDIALTIEPSLAEPGVLPESMPGAGGGIVFKGTWTRN